MPSRSLSLRARLLIGVIGLVAAGLVVSSTVTYFALDRFLSTRVDQQLADSRLAVLNELAQGEQHFRRFEPSGRSVIPSGTYGELRRSSGGVVRLVETDLPLPHLPDSSPPVERFLTVGSSEGGYDYRVLSTPLGGAGVLLVAVPLEDKRDTLSQLLGIELLVAAIVLSATAAAGWWAVQVGLKPLVQIEDTADAIAAGDLTRRVERAEPVTEVGKLGLALNAMLGQIEEAFAERRASEDRLRQFVADASHELRTPLTSIRGYAEMFRRGAADNADDLDTIMRRIEEEAARMGVLVEDLLLLARLDQGRPLERAPVDLSELAADAVSDLRAVAPDRDVSVDNGRPVIVDGDDARLRQVIGNLLTNAKVHTPAGTAIHVRVAAEDGAARLVVADDGPGIDPALRSRVFERFFRADEARARATGGSGLGLAIVAAIVAAHGGTARLDDGAEGGAVFVIDLPLASTSPEPAAPEPTHPTGGRSA